MSHGRFIGLLLALALAGAGNSLPAAAEGGAAGQGQAAVSALPRAVLELPARAQGAASGTVWRLRVEVAATDAARARGLMFRRELADDAGMLFLWSAPRRVAMWMKNTLLPLDMVFIDADGCIMRVHEGAVPGDLTPIASGAPVIAVLEVKAGMARRLGLRRGVCLKLPGRKEAAGQDALRRSDGGDR